MNMIHLIGIIMDCWEESKDTSQCCYPEELLYCSQGKLIDGLCVVDVEVSCPDSIEEELCRRRQGEVTCKWFTIEGGLVDEECQYSFTKEVQEYISNKSYDTVFRKYRYFDMEQIRMVDRIEEILEDLRYL